MLSGRITKWTLVALGVAAVVLYARGLVHDLSLQTTLVRKGLAHLPAMVVEHIGVEREFSGVLWKGSVNRAERGESGILLSSIDLLGEWPEGRRVKFIAPEARFEEASELATLDHISGAVWYVAESADETAGGIVGDEIRFEAKRARWKNGSREIFFPEGIAIFSPKGSLRGHSASASLDGEFRIEGGAILTWDDADRFLR